MTPLRSFVEHDRRQAVFRERKPSVRWVLPEGRYNPAVAEGVRWLDYERAAETDADPAPPAAAVAPEPAAAPATAKPGEPLEPVKPAEHAEHDWFDREQRPPRLAGSRPYGVPGGLARPDPQVERDLAESLRPGARFPDPRGTWVRLVNGGGPADDPFRATNAADCALAVLSTWHGEPAAAAPRLPEYDRIGRPLLTGERGGTARIECWVGHRLQYAGQGRHAYPMIARRLGDAGHGAAAVIVVRWPGGGCHVWNAVNTGGEVIWIDAQRGHMSVEPPYTTVTGVFCVIIDRQGRPR
ncbi:toxin glutamine deamidase domain-containing protein [Nonomuraea sp. B12E4]|uniref:toxin glutamine deamidase domain-containing protein n=1 Tax=Nonomuraea sp. B12E4 TaxID=3153564 RepID=UPI00325E4E5E